MKRKLVPILLAALLLLSAAACGASGGGNLSAAGSAGGSTSATSGMDGGADYYVPSAEPNESAETISSNLEAGQEIKMIRTADLELESTDFETALSGLERLVEDLNGYLEDSTLYAGGSSRWASYTVRVPAGRFQEFLTQAGDLCHLVRQSTSAENITEAYYDTQGRLKTQQIKLERLQNLLAQAENMEDIITLESAISETEYNIDNLSGALWHYDALVDYATIYVSLSEVYRLTSVETVPDSFASRLGTAFSSGLGNFGQWLENLAVGLAYSWLWLLLLAAIIWGVIHIVRRQSRFSPPDENRKNDPPKL